jgi:hypothetical protein
MRPTPPKQEAPIKRLSGKQLLKTRNIPDTKVCKKCGQHLPAERFHYAPANKDGLMNFCIECHRSMRDEYNEIRRLSRAEERGGRITRKRGRKETT